MAMYTLIEINGDHLSDLLGKGIDVGMALQTIVRNTFNAPRVLEETDLYRVLRVVKQSGERYDNTLIVKDGNKPEDASAVKSDLSGRPKWEEIMRKAQEVVVEELPTLEEVYNQLSNSNAQWLNTTDRLNTAIEVHARQITQINTRVEDLEDENSVEAVAKRVDEVARRVMALEQWRKS